MIKTDQFRETSDAFKSLRQFARSKPSAPAEKCEMCAAELYPEHSHLIELTQRRLHCACEACAMLFSGRAGTKYRRVPRDARILPDFKMTDAEWEALLIPINLAFFFQNSTNHRVSALYPSPAGATESLLPLESWTTIVDVNPVLNQLEPDVEALLVNRVGQSRGSGAAEYYIVPIDACYKLVGLIRINWRGLSGGTEVWQEIGSFFANLRAKARVEIEETHA